MRKSCSDYFKNVVEGMIERLEKKSFAKDEKDHIFFDGFIEGAKFCLETFDDACAIEKAVVKEKKNKK